MPSQKGTKPPLELPSPPSPRRTRAANKTKVVGAPDMSKPRRTHQEVLDECAAQEQAKAATAEKERQVRQRIAELEVNLQETLPPLARRQPSGIVHKRGATAAANAADIADPPNMVGSETASQVQEEVDDANEEGTYPVLPSRSSSSSPLSNVAARVLDPASDGEQHASTSDNEDNYVPSEHDAGSDMDIDSQPINAPNASKKKPTKQGARQQGSTGTECASAAAVGVGKRKNEGDAEPTKPVASKKLRPNQVRSSALVKDWDKITSNSAHHGRSFTPGPSRSHTPVHRASRSSSQASAPPSSASEGDGLTSEHGYADDGDNRDPPPSDGDSEAIKGDIRAALRYRSKAESVMVHDSIMDEDDPLTTTVASSTSKSRKPALVQDALTQVKTRTSSTQDSRRSKATGKPLTADHSLAIKSSAPIQAKEARGSGSSGKIKITDMPAPLLQLFTSHTQTPWEEIKFSELEKLYHKAFGEELAVEYPLEEGKPVCKLNPYPRWPLLTLARKIGYKISDWHTGFATAARQTFKDIITDPDYKDHFPDTTAIGEYARYLLGDAKKKAPFYWQRWNGGNEPIGRLQGTMVVGTFAHHISEIQTLKGTDRVLDFAIGALTLAVLAATHTLTHYSTGEWNPPPKRLGFFSSDNYGDRHVFENGKMTIDKRMSRVLAVVKDLDDDEWTVIYTAAFKVAKDREVKARKKVIVPAEPEPGVSDDDELMLPKNPKPVRRATSDPDESEGMEEEADCSL